MDLHSTTISFHRLHIVSSVRQAASAAPCVFPPHLSYFPRLQRCHLPPHSSYFPSELRGHLADSSVMSLKICLGSSISYLQTSYVLLPSPCRPHPHWALNAALRALAHPSPQNGLKYLFPSRTGRAFRHRIGRSAS